jgi:hypothetical protein
VGVRRHYDSGNAGRAAILQKPEYYRAKNFGARSGTKAGRCRMNRREKTIAISSITLGVILLMVAWSMTVFAAGDVATAIQSTWTAAKTQVQSVVNNVVFPVIDMVLAILFFVKVGTAFFDYRKHGQFEFTAPCILFACLIFTLTAPLYIWTIL